mmetsp:Transcript_31936/g.94052  ORF Transcript_31936/g.94052 Transcript_31936/m.94052 type:complete len:217 (+) Transcript_31936:260-910(+)
MPRGALRRPSQRSLATPAAEQRVADLCEDRPSCCRGSTLHGPLLRLGRRLGRRRLLPRLRRFRHPLRRSLSLLLGRLGLLLARLHRFRSLGRLRGRLVRRRLLCLGLLGREGGCLLRLLQVHLDLRESSLLLLVHLVLRFRSLGRLLRLRRRRHDCLFRLGHRRLCRRGSLLRLLCVLVGLLVDDLCHPLLVLGRFVGGLDIRGVCGRGDGGVGVV